MIARLILKTQKKWQLGLAMCGAIFGLTMLLMSLQLYLDIKKIFDTQSDLVSPEYLIVNKQVSLLNFFFKSAQGFSKDEIADFKKLNAVDAVEGFESNSFSAKASMQNNDEAGSKILSTDLFFESVPNNVLDIKPDKWQWDSSMNTIPIVIPSDYINLYNFGFAPSQDLPQISKSTIGLINFNIKINGKKNNAEYQGHIVGFSNRINTILVPQSFLRYANNHFGDGETKQPSRLIVLCKNPNSPELQSYLQSKSYESNSESFKNDKLSSLLKMLLGIVSVIGVIIVFLSLLSFIQYAQLLIGNARYEIRTLIQIGYYYMKIAAVVSSFFTVLFSIVFFISMIIVYIIKYQTVAYISRFGFEISSSVSPSVILYGILLVLGLILLNSISVASGIKRQTK